MNGSVLHPHLHSQASNPYSSHRLYQQNNEEQRDNENEECYFKVVIIFIILHVFWFNFLLLLEEFINLLKSTKILKNL